MAGVNWKAIYVQEGRNIEVTAAANQTRGDVVVLGGLVGIATKDAVSGATDQVIDVHGVYDVVKEAGVSFAVGDLVYWTGTAANATASGNTKLGRAIVAVTGGAERVRVKLLPS